MIHDYLIIGLGLAGLSFCEQLEEDNKTYKVVSDDSQRSSLVAGGLYNPVILKRFSLAWNADIQLQTALPFYKKLEDKFRIQLDHKISVLRRFASIEEQNLWFEAADKPRLNKFLSPKISLDDIEGIDAPYGYGEVKHTGRIDSNKLITTYTSFLEQKGNLIKETFRFNKLKIHSDYVEYNSTKAHKIVFATGFGLRDNPFFNYLPLKGTKGELLTVRIPELELSRIVKSSVFIIPLQNDLFRVGATYNNYDKTNVPTEDAKVELVRKLESFLKCNYEIVDHVAGIRPSVVDRKPIVGRHHVHKHMYVLNGLGSRGVLIAPSIAKQLYEHIENGQPLSEEIDIDRFSKKYLTTAS